MDGVGDEDHEPDDEKKTAKSAKRSITSSSELKKNMKLATSQTSTGSRNMQLPQFGSATSGNLDQAHINVLSHEFDTAKLGNS